MVLQAKSTVFSVSRPKKKGTTDDLQEKVNHYLTHKDIEWLRRV